jgi:hypothetical protein
MACKKNDMVLDIFIDIQSIFKEFANPCLDWTNINSLLTKFDKSPYKLYPFWMINTGDEIVALNNIIYIITLIPAHLTDAVSLTIGNHHAIKYVSWIVAMVLRIVKNREYCQSGNNSDVYSNIQKLESDLADAGHQLKNGFKSLQETLKIANTYLTHVIDPPNTTASLWAAITSLFKPHPQPAC